MDKVTFKYERKGDKQFYRDVEFSFDYDPDGGIKELISGFKTFLYGLSYHPNTIERFLGDDGDDECYVLTDKGKEND